MKFPWIPSVGIDDGTFEGARRFRSFLVYFLMVELILDNFKISFFYSQNMKTRKSLAHFSPFTAEKIKTERIVT